jgi:enoyl-CoA hydratase
MTTAEAPGTSTGTGDASLLTRQQGDVRWLSLNRPQRRNALNPGLVTALRREILAAMADLGTAAVVITGEGPSFCSGADLQHLHALASDGGDPVAFLAEVSDCFTGIEQSPKPVVAAVHGHVVAGGLELALACDVVVAREGTFLGDGHVTNGLVPAGGASVRLPRKVGEPLARWLMLTGELLPAEAFTASGFVHAIAPAGQFDAVIAGVLDALRGSPAARGLTKQLLASLNRPGRDEALGRELATFARNWKSADIPAALARFAGPATGGPGASQ